jgi:hypothetical protein
MGPSACGVFDAEYATGSDEAGRQILDTRKFGSSLRNVLTMLINTRLALDGEDVPRSSGATSSFLPAG